MGDVRPAGWLREQMLRDLTTGMAGSLDQLCPEAADDIFCTGRRTKTVAINAGNGRHQPTWWNGETEGNWRAGFMALAALCDDPASLRKAEAFLQRLQASTDDDGYFGVYSKDLKYGHPGDLWTQGCLLRGMLGYAEITRNRAVYDAVVRCVDADLAAYAPGKKKLDLTQSHDLMISDVLERLYDITGDAKYRDFMRSYYEQWNPVAQRDITPGDEDVSLDKLLLPDHPYVGHGVHTVEHVRVPLWLAAAVNTPDYNTAAQHAVERLERYLVPSGATVCGDPAGGKPAPECIANDAPDPNKQYEYCTIKETQQTFQSAFQKTGNAAYAERVERVFFNAAQGGRLPDGTGLAYSSPDNRLHCDGQAHDHAGTEARNKFSPTQMDVAVCCNPMSTNVTPQFVRGMWMRHADGGLVAALYGPCKVSTTVTGKPVALESRTSYPFENTVEIAIHANSAGVFNLRLRNPEWSANTRVLCSGATITRDGDFWLLSKHWKSGDTIAVHFTPVVREVKACNGEVALQHGALLYAQALPAIEKSIHDYSIPRFHDMYYLPASKPEPLALVQADGSYGFMPVAAKTTASVLRPYDAPGLKLHGRMKNTASGEMVSMDLVPFGSAPKLRRLTFPVASPATKT